MSVRRSPILYRKNNGWQCQDVFTDGNNEKWICASGLNEIFPDTFDNVEEIQVVAGNYPESTQIPRGKRVVITPDVHSLPVSREDFTEVFIRHFGENTARWFSIFEPLANFIHDCMVAGFSTFTVEVINAKSNVSALPARTDETREAA